MIKKIITSVLIGASFLISSAYAQETKTGSPSLSEQKSQPTSKSTGMFSSLSMGPNVPYVSLQSVDTGYGQLGCMQRAESKVYQIGATAVTKSNNSVIGTYGGTEKIVIWCRGSEVIVTVAGQNPWPVKDDIVKVF